MTEVSMASITIRNIEDELKERLRIRAARHGHSMEEEARTILRRAVGGISGSELLELSENLFGKEHGVELELPSRSSEREAPRFD